MLVKKIIRLCAVLVLSGVSSVSFSQSLTFYDALQLIDDQGVADIPSDYTSIDVSAFKNTNVKKVVIPNSVISIGASAFENTHNLQEVLLPESLEIIADDTFRNSAITKMILPDSLLRVDSRAFHASNIEEINFPSSLTYIGSHAFSKSKISHLSIPSGVDVRDMAFASVPLVSLTVGSNVNFEHDVFLESNTLIQVIETNSNIQSFQNFVSVDHLNIGGNTSYRNKGLYFRNLNSANLKMTILGDEVSSIDSTIGDGFSAYGASLVVKSNLISNVDISATNISLINPAASFPLSRVTIYAAIGLCSQDDSDNDGHQDCYDQFPNDPDRWFDYSDSAETNTTELVHSDGDGLADIFDLSPTDGNQADSNSSSNTEYAVDTDGDGFRNDRDIDDDDDGLLDIYEPFFGTNPLIPDSDFDGTLDGIDAFPLDNTESLDTDSDGIGNNADTDDDNDGHFDLLDAFPLDANEWMDSDLDGVGNNADTDDDNDGVLDEEDAFPYTASESVDTDGDGVGDNSDAFPNDSSETLDTDLDGIGNNADDDDDNDGVVDADDSDPLNDAIGALESQNLFVMGNPVAVNGYLATISVGYDVSDDNNQLTGIGFRVHYDSSIYSYSAVESTINESLIVDGMGPYQDIEDFDNDSTTDSYIVFGWAAVNADWPNIELPAKLTDIQLFVNWDDYDAGSTTSNINFSIVDNAEGYEAKTTDYAMTVLPATWDFDGNGSADALTDGLMLLRYTFGIRDLRMASGAMAQNSTLSATQVVDNMHRAISVADIDGNDSTDALTDGLILLRYLFGLRGENLISGAISSDATRTTQEQIEQYLSLYMPEALVSPVQSEQGFLVGDWKLASVPHVRVYSEGVLTDWNTDPWGMTQSIFENCVQDDIYRFGSNGTFEYLINGSTYLDYEINPLYDDSDEGFCAAPFEPWNEDEIYTYSIDENDGELTVNGFGAFIVLAHVANGTNDIESPAEAPESITYQYSKISEEQILLEIDAFSKFYRFTLERVLGN